LGRLVGPPIAAVVHGVRLPLDLREYIQRTMFLRAYEPEQTAWMRRYDMVDVWYRL